MADDGINSQAASPTGASSALVSLGSLASRYEESQHKTYLKRLDQAVADERNRSIALTRRYGTGKSSVLDEFEKHHKNTLRLAISTLGPDSQGVTTTNRIQKDLVKQLVYSASPSTLRHSRFSRISSLPKGRTLVESVAVVSVLGLLLALLGWLPPLAGTGGGVPWYEQLGRWVLFGGLLSLVLTGVRLVTHDRFVVSDVSAAGATVKLSERTPTYFDEYLDEIVNYFDEEPVDVVILEDLDRFDDPHIFEALRELNTLLNSTPKRLKKGTPLRFVYAVRDSLFEKLGSDTVEQSDDAATAETVRANRTKFFDLVIPVVPFISHRNARELLSDLLEQANITGVDRRLVDLVAQHATDMRLLRNMRNEYLVFAERLLEQKKRAPGLSANDLFALVAYKNFHLEDFDQISRRCSDLDLLYEYRRDLVRSSVNALERRKRDLLAGRARIRSMEADAERLGARLQRLAAFVRANSQYSGWPHLRYRVEDVDFTKEQTETYDFWIAVARAEEVRAFVSSSPTGAGQALVTLRSAHLAEHFPEVSEVGRWLEMDEEKTRATIAHIDRDSAFLRGADFKDLAGADGFTLSVNETESTFSQLVDDTLKSELATELVKHGHIDRNFALYAAQFYGDFAGSTWPPSSCRACRPTPWTSTTASPAPGQ